MPPLAPVVYLAFGTRGDVQPLVVRSPWFTPFAKSYEYRFKTLRMIVFPVTRALLRFEEGIDFVWMTDTCNRFGENFTRPGPPNHLRYSSIARGEWCTPWHTPWAWTLQTLHINVTLLVHERYTFDSIRYRVSHTFRNWIERSTPWAWTIHTFSMNVTHLQYERYTHILHVVSKESTV
jgi:hypothetical protein